MSAIAAQHNGAAAVMATEPECVGKVNKKRLNLAMQRLFAAKKIKIEKYGRPSRPQQRIVPATGKSAAPGAKEDFGGHPDDAAFSVAWRQAETSTSRHIPEEDEGHILSRKSREIFERQEREACVKDQNAQKQGGNVEGES
jgi:hypothetical protein